MSNTQRVFAKSYDFEQESTAISREIKLSAQKLLGSTKSKSDPSVYYLAILSFKSNMEEDNFNEDNFGNALLNVHVYKLKLNED